MVLQASELVSPYNAVLKSHFYGYLDREKGQQILEGRKEGKHTIVKRWCC